MPARLHSGWGWGKWVELRGKDGNGVWVDWTGEFLASNVLPSRELRTSHRFPTSNVPKTFGHPNILGRGIVQVVQACFFQLAFEKKYNPAFRAARDIFGRGSDLLANHDIQCYS